MGLWWCRGSVACGLVPDAAVAVPDLHLFPGCQPEDRVRMFRRTGRLVNGFPMFRVPPAHLLSPKTTQPQLTRTIPRRQTIPLIPSHKSSGNSLADDLHDNNRSSNQDNTDRNQYRSPSTCGFVPRAPLRLPVVPDASLVDPMGSGPGSSHLSSTRLCGGI